MARLDPRPYPGAWEYIEGEDWADHSKRCEKLLTELLDASRRLPPDEVVGVVLRFSRGDGYAFYVVTREKPLTLQHVPFLDNWTIDDAHIRGIRRQDVIEATARDRRIATLFGWK